MFLHEGLGSVALWRDFPDKVAARLGARRSSTPASATASRMGCSAKRTPRFMHEEALDVLPALLDQLGIARPLLIGHSDGASIALIHAAASGRPVRGLVLMAPHVFVEPICVESIARIRETYRTTDLARAWPNTTPTSTTPSSAGPTPGCCRSFWSWSIEDLLPACEPPLLLIQGRDDEYGTLAQLDRIEAAVHGPPRASCSTIAATLPTATRKRPCWRPSSRSPGGSVCPDPWP